MSKICGYSCEHNKSGVCQITGCSKKSYMSDKTETELFRETWYDINQIRQLQQENKQLKMINKEYERLDNGKPRGFVITRVDEYDIYDLLSYKENWNKLKMWLNNFHRLSGFEQWEIVNKMQELERGSDNQ